MFGLRGRRFLGSLHRFQNRSPACGPRSEALTLLPPLEQHRRGARLLHGLPNLERLSLRLGRLELLPVRVRCWPEPPPLLPESGRQVRLAHWCWPEQKPLACASSVRRLLLWPPEPDGWQASGPLPQRPVLPTTQEPPHPHVQPRPVGSREPACPACLPRFPGRWPAEPPRRVAALECGPLHPLGRRHPACCWLRWSCGPEPPHRGRANRCGQWQCLGRWFQACLLNCLPAGAGPRPFQVPHWWEARRW